MSSPLANISFSLQILSRSLLSNTALYGLKVCKRAKHANLPLLIAFFTCLLMYLRALSGAGYDEHLYGALDARELPEIQSPLSRWASYAQEGLSRVTEFPTALWRCSDAEDGNIRDWCLEKNLRPLQQGSKILGVATIEKESGGFTTSNSMMQSADKMKDTSANLAGSVAEVDSGRTEVRYSRYYPKNVQAAKPRWIAKDQ